MSKNKVVLTTEKIQKRLLKLETKAIPKRKRKLLKLVN